MLKVLFISRAYPPTLGGIEKQNHSIYLGLSSIADVSLIANKRGKNFLTLFFPIAFFRALFSVKKVDVILLGDGVLAPLGYALGLLSGKPVVSIVHGLDITFKNRFYQRFFVRFSLSRLNKLLAVGNETIKQGVQRGIDEKRFVFIPNGVDIDRQKLNKTQAFETLGLTNNKTYLLTLGRLVKRKGVAWFVDHVASSLQEDVVYLVAGDGPDKEAIEAAIDQHGLRAKVKMLGRVSEEEKAALYQVADVFIQPNIPVDGDMEGFGLVVLEAAINRLPVLASRLEGLKDAISDGESGCLIEPMDAEAYLEAINKFIEDKEYSTLFGEKAAAYVAENLAWDSIAQLYKEELEQLVK